MAGFGSVLGDVFEKAAGTFVQGWGRFFSDEAGAYGYTRSTEALFNKSESGKVMSKYLNSTFEPKARQIMQDKLTSKVAAGLKPDIAAKEAVREGFQEARKMYLGQKDEALIKFVRAAHSERGSIYANSVADALSVYLHDSSNYWKTRNIGTKTSPVSLKGIVDSKVLYSNPSEMEQGLRRALSWMYTPLVAIPHAAQTTNILLDNINTPIKTIGSAMAEYFSTGPTKAKFQNDLIRSGALFDEIRYNIMEDINSKGRAGIFYKLFNHPGFGFVRRQEIAMAAAIGKHAAMEAADRLSANGSDRWAEYALNKLGLDVKKIAGQQYKLLDEDILKAMYTEADRTIFLRNQLKTPWKWEENFLARLGSQYRHFQFRQTKFLSEVFRDAYREKGYLGLTKALGTFALLFPAAGELVHMVENMAEGKSPLERDPKNQFGGNEYTDALAHAAGFGIFYSISRAGMWNGGRGFLEGPILGTLEDIFIGVPSDLKQGRYRAASKKILNKLGAPGRFAANQITKNKDNP